MGTISNARASYGLSATGLPTKTNVSGVSTIGLTQTLAALDADIAYSFKVDGNRRQFWRGPLSTCRRGLSIEQQEPPTVIATATVLTLRGTLLTTVIYAVQFEFDATAAGGTSFRGDSTNAALGDIPLRTERT